MSDFDFDTLAVRAGQVRSQFGEHSEAMYLTSSFVFENAAQAAARFSGEMPGMVYARFTNPTVNMLQERLAALEGGQRCVATASGMSAILATVMALLKAGDHIVSSRSIFGATQQLFSNIIGKFAVTTTFVDATNLDAYRAALTPNTKLMFIETPSNPLTEIVDIDGLAQIAKRAGVLLVVDNCFCTPALQKPLELGADIVIHSATKYLDGQGRVLGGAVVGSNETMDEVFKFLRTAGPTLSPFNAWVILKGLETLRIRMEAQSPRRWNSRTGSRRSRGWPACTIRVSHRIRNTRWRCVSKRAAERSSPSKSPVAERLHGGWWIAPGCCRSRRTWVTPRAPSPIRQVPRMGVSRQRHVLRRVLLKGCCGLPSGWSRWPI